MNSWIRTFIFLSLLVSACSSDPKVLYDQEKEETQAPDGDSDNTLLVDLSVQEDFEIPLTALVPHFSGDTMTVAHRQGELVTMAFPAASEADRLASAQNVPIHFLENGRPAVTVVDEDGNSIPFQAEADRFHEDVNSDGKRPVELVKLRMLMDIEEGRKNLVVRKGAGVSPGDDLASDLADSIAVNTGVMVVEINSHTTELSEVIEGARVGGEDVLDGFEFDFADSLSALATQVSDIRIEENGPVFASVTGDFVMSNSNGDGVLTGEATWKFTRDSAKIGFEFSFTPGSVGYPMHVILSKGKIRANTVMDSGQQRDAHFLDVDGSVISYPIDDNDSYSQRLFANDLYRGSVSDYNGLPFVSVCHSCANKFMPEQGWDVVRGDGDQAVRDETGDFAWQTAPLATVVGLSSPTSGVTFGLNRGNGLFPLELDAKTISAESHVGFDIGASDFERVFTYLVNYIYKFELNLDAGFDAKERMAEEAIRMDRPTLAVVKSEQYNYYFEKYGMPRTVGAEALQSYYDQMNVPMQVGLGNYTPWDDWTLVYYMVEGGGWNNTNTCLRRLNQGMLYKHGGPLLNGAELASYKLRVQIKHTPRGASYTDAPYALNYNQVNAITGHNGDDSHYRVMNLVVAYFLGLHTYDELKNAYVKDLEEHLTTKLNKFTRPMGLYIASMAYYLLWHKVENPELSAALLTKLEDEGFLDLILRTSHQNAEVSGVSGWRFASPGNGYRTGVPDVYVIYDPSKGGWYTNTFFYRYWSEALYRLHKALGPNHPYSQDAMLRQHDVAYWMTHTYTPMPQRDYEWLSQQTHAFTFDISKYAEGPDHQGSSAWLEAYIQTRDDESTYPHSKDLLDAHLKELEMMFKCKQMGSLQSKTDWMNAVYLWLNHINE